MATPSGVGSTPLLHTDYMLGTLEIIRIIKQPLLLTGHFTLLTALRLEAILLALSVTVIRRKELCAAPAFPFLDTFHDPKPPGQSSNIRRNMERKD